MSEPSLSNVDFKNKMTWAWTTLKIEIQRKIMVFGKYFIKIEKTSIFFSKDNSY